MIKKEKLITLIAVVLITAKGCYTWWNYQRHQMMAHDPSGIESVLRMAGKNRKELNTESFSERVPIRRKRTNLTNG